MTANDYYFMVDKENDCFFFVEKQYWEENGAIDDCIAEEFEALLPHSVTVYWGNEMESCFAPHIRGTFKNASIEDGIKMLVAAGFTQIDNPWEAKG